MLFNSLHFLVFFPIVLLVYYLIPTKWRYLWLLATSYYFYMCWNAKYALLLFFSTAVTYVSGYVLERVRAEEQDSDIKKRRMNICVFVSFALNLGILFWFKYFDFAVENINQVLGKLHITLLNPQFDIILPVGISFYTFQALGYTMDVYRGEIKAEKNFLKYALFVSFFPQLVAGPIERSKNLLAQVNREHRFSEEKFCDGVYLMIWGYFLKLVLADRIAIVVNQIYGDVNQYGGMYLIVATILFAFQIYCDFAGYSIIAMGAAKILGFDLMDNFDAPYFSQSVAEFWRRWHISLSSWFKDYLYIPLGGNRKGTVRKHINNLIVFGVSGLWHGANWTYVIWGLLNAVFQIVGSVTAKTRSRIYKTLHLNETSAAHKAMKVLVTFVCVDFAWIFFRAESLSHAKAVIKSMLGVINPQILFDGSLYGLEIGRTGFLLMMFGILILVIADFFKYRGICIREKIKEQDFWFRAFVVSLSICFIAVCGVWGPAYTDSTFIYFQF